MNISQTWHSIYTHVEQIAKSEPMLEALCEHTVLKHNNLIDALSTILSQKLARAELDEEMLRTLINESLHRAQLESVIVEDLSAVIQRDSACDHQATAFLFYKGFHALQVYRIAHYLWHRQQRANALFFQSLSASRFNVDIHPAAVLGHGIMIDHATGIVIGETARVGNDVSIMQSVTLGGTGKEDHDRHPKIADGVLISCGAKILGNINIAKGAKIAAGSVVLKDIEAYTTVAGVPAQIIGIHNNPSPALHMEHSIDCEQVNNSLKNNNHNTP